MGLIKIQFFKNLLNCYASFTFICFGVGVSQTVLRKIQYLFWGGEFNESPRMWYYLGSLVLGITRAKLMGPHVLCPETFARP